MEDEKLVAITSSIEEKLGKEAAATIADDLGLLITENSNTQKLIESQADQIKNLESKNEKLITANGNLLQQIPMGKIEERKAEEEKTSSKINLKDAFDSKGNFIH